MRSLRQLVALLSFWQNGSAGHGHRRYFPRISLRPGSGPLDAYSSIKPRKYSFMKRPAGSRRRRTS
jgi:hypothetical protein